MNDEIWKDIPGFTGYYQASNRGRVKSLNRVATAKAGDCPRKLKGKILKSYATKYGHEYCSLYKNGESMVEYVHRLVFRAFIGDIEDGLVIDHINGKPNDNRIDNLRAISHRENVSRGWCRNLPTGVYQLRGKYYIQPYINGAKVCEGGFNTVAEAKQRHKQLLEEV